MPASLARNVTEVPPRPRSGKVVEFVNIAMDLKTKDLQLVPPAIYNNARQNSAQKANRPRPTLTTKRRTKQENPARPRLKLDGETPEEFNAARHPIPGSRQRRTDRDPLTPVNHSANTRGSTKRPPLWNQQHPEGSPPLQNDLNAERRTPNADRPPPTARRPYAVQPSRRSDASGADSANLCPVEG